MKFVDFAELKERVSFAQAISILNVPMHKHGNQWRAPCPACGKGGDRALVVTEGKGFFCFASHKGGDVIAFAAHIRKCSVKDAAMFLSKDEAPQQQARSEPTGEKGMEALSYLEHDHAAVLGVGFDPEFCKRHGIGYASKGLMRGTIAVPFRDENGNLLGYLGICEARLPPSFTTNVVDFDSKKRA